jgi:broad specificity phosphatase PhoE
MIMYLIRHGRSMANERRLVTGTPADSLSHAGRRQAEALGAWLTEQSVRPERFLVSHWNRARETAACIYPDAQWLIDPRLGETNAGSVADFPLERFVREHPFFYDHPTNVYPGGESHLDLNGRVQTWLNDQLQQSCRSVAVVAHSGSISCLLQHVLQIDMASFPALLPAHATVSIVHFSLLDSVWKGRLAGFSLGPAENIAGVFHGDA